MKAAVLHQLGQAPKYEDFPDPVPQGKDQALLHMKAASVKNLDKGRASGTHYASHKNLPEVVGVDGVGAFNNGQRVYAPGITGMVAELALVDPSRVTPLPDHIDDVTAAALPNAMLGAALALRSRGKIQSGNVVIINGATGVTGQVAVQLAKLYGAKKVIATGRNEESMKALLTLGADEVISLKETDEAFIRSVKKIHEDVGVDIVIDYLWGKPAELILHALKGTGLHTAYQSVRFVTVGSMAGENITVASGSLRSSAIEILGSGFGSIPPEDMSGLATKIIPEAFDLAAAGKLKIQVETAPLSDIESAWNRNVPAGKRLVITI
jgi:NADPH:quinone reductase-like Zn-dependent oxidoreductase